MRSDHSRRTGNQFRDWRSFRFKLSSLLIFIVTMCFVFALVGVKLRGIERQRAAGAKLEAKGTHVTYKYGDVVTIQPFGDVSDDDLILLKSFPHLNMLFLQDSHLGDSALRHTQGLKDLEWLVLSDLPVTDSGVRLILDVPRLRYLYLARTLVTDNCASHLAKLKGLEYLNIEGTKITAEGLKELHDGLPNAEIEY